MNILIINYGPKPLPATEGGAVETLIQILLNSIGGTDTATVVSYAPRNPFPPDTSDRIKYVYINDTSISLKIKKAFRYTLNRWSPFSFDNAFIYEVIKCVDLTQFDVIISENGVCFGHALRKYYDGRIVLHLHNDWLNKDSKFAVDYKNSYDEIWAISEFIKGRVDEIAGCTETKVLYNGVDMEQFSQHCVKENRSQYRKKYKIGEAEFTFCYCGRIVEEKGVEQLLEAFQHLTDDPSFANCRLVVIGDNSLPTEYCRKIRNFCRNVVWTGYLDRTEIHKVMSMADCGVAPTVHLMKYYQNKNYRGFIEAFNLTVIEFMALGIPVLATDSGGMKELITEGVTGYRVSCVEDTIVRYLTEAMRKMVTTYIPNTEACVERARVFSKEAYLACFYRYLREAKGKNAIY